MKKISTNACRVDFINTFTDTLCQAIMLYTKLIERALQLTGKTMEEMNIDYIAYCEIPVENEFSIEKFCYYLLSPEFIEKYD